jgi:hypothetical protein
MLSKLEHHAPLRSGMLKYRTRIASRTRHSNAKEPATDAIERGARVIWRLIQYTRAAATYVEKKAETFRLSRPVSALRQRRPALELLGKSLIQS